MSRTLASMPRFLVRDFATCLSFNGTSARIDVGNPANLTSGLGAGAWSIFAWVKTNDLGVRKSIYSFGDRANTGKAGYIYIGTDNLLHFDFTNAAANTGAKFIPDNKWHLVGATFTGSTLQLYTDAATDGSSTAQGPLIASGGVIIGDSLNGDPHLYFKNLMDDVIFANAAFSPTDITNLYYSGIQPSGVLSRWKFDEGSGTTANDSVGANNGTITAATYSSDVFSKARTLAS